MSCLCAVPNIFGQVAVTTLTYNYTGAVQNFTVPPLCVNSITIEARGAQGGGYGAATGGLGARMIGVVNVTPGQVLQLYVGGQGTSSQNSGCGGGGTGVINGNTPLVIAGGGGGGCSTNNTENGQGGQITTAGGNSSGMGGTNGNGGEKGLMSGDCGWAGGGGGFLGDGYGGDGTWDGGALPGTLSGPAAGIARANGGAGGTGGSCGFSATGTGGWGCGGGGRGEYAGGGGGGYSGGGGGHYTDGPNERRGGGGGSYNAGSNQSNTAGYQSGDGLIIISYEAGNAIAASSNPSVICNGYSAVLSVVGPDNYVWDNGQPGTQISVFPTSSTVYTVTGTDPNTGCSVTATTAVGVIPSPAVAITTLKNSVCEGESVSLSAIGAPSYTWSQGPTYSNAITVFPTLSNNTYSVYGSDATGCAGLATVQINVNPNPVPTVLGSVIICSLTSANLTGSGASTYQWSSNTGFLTVNPVTLSPKVTTTYTLQGTDANGCKGSTVFAIVVEPCTGIQNIGASSGQVMVYPNPGPGIFNVELANGLEKTIEVMDVNGRLIMSDVYKKDVSEINISNLSNGIYYVKVKSGTISEVIKVVKD